MGSNANGIGSIYILIKQAPVVPGPGLIESLEGFIVRRDADVDKEVQVFREFLRKSDLAFELDSIEKREPPEPDILCRSSQGEWVAFELVEVCVRENAAFMGRAPVVAELIERTYKTLSPELRAKFDDRFSGRPLSFEFGREASTNLIRDLLPRILSELADQPRNTDLFKFSSVANQALVGVRMRGRVDDRNRPTFNIDGFFRPDDTVVDTVASKLKKIYVTSHPIELVAHFGGHAFEGDTDSWKRSLRKTLESQSLGRFRRVWVQGWEGMRFVYPSTL